ncbi:MAG: sulfite exporter TauE/SafE family protein [bacterium]|nr:sulfite exporter TauE/SafE family protein [bacterium]
MIHELTEGQWVALGVAGLLIGAAKAGVVGGTILVIPLLASVFPAKSSTGILLPLLCVGDVVGIVAYRRHGRWDIIRRVFPPAAVGVIVGYLLMGRITDGQLRRLIGCIVLGLLVLQYRMSHSNLDGVRRHPMLAVLVGLLVGFTTMTANASGPIMTLYLLMCGLEKREFVGTMAWCYLCVNIFKIPFSAQLGLITRDSLVVNGLVVPAIVLGGVGGYFFVQRVSQRVFDALMVGLAAGGAVYLLW